MRSEEEARELLEKAGDVHSNLKARGMAAAINLAVLGTVIKTLSWVLNETEDSPLKFLIS